MPKLIWADNVYFVSQLKHQKCKICIKNLINVDMHEKFTSMQWL